MLSRMLKAFRALPLPLCLGIFSLFSLGSRASAVPDDASTLNRKVWQMLYAVTDAQLYVGGNPANGLNTTWLNADADGDGVTNGGEVAAGTNPFLVSSTFGTTSMTSDATSVSLTFPTAKGKTYVAQTNTSLTNSAGWADLVPAVQVTGDGNPKTLVAPAAAVTTYYRVVVRDLDSDGDGVSDWAETVVGYKPTVAKTDGVTDDNVALTNALATSNIITVTANDLTATQPVNTATAPADLASFTINRMGTLLFSSVTVPLQKSGTAVEGVDYDALPASVTIPPKAHSVTLTLSPRANPSLQTNATATLIALPGGGYKVGSPGSASVVIYPTDAASGTGFTAEYWNTSTTAPPATPTTPPLITRTESTIDANWIYGTPNGIAFLSSADNYSVSWEGYLAPSTAGSYSFQLDADHQARVYLDLNDGAGFQQILENGWDSAATGTFKQSAAFNLAVPASASERYRMRVEYIETTGSATCRFQWKLNTGAYANIPSGNVFTTNVGATTGWIANYYDGTNTTLSSNTLKRTQTDSAITNGNNGIWGTGTPDPAINRNNFFARWTGHVQPQYSERYYFVPRADDGVRLWVNNQLIVDKWVNSGVTDYVGSIDLQAGVRYEIKMEYFENTGLAEAHLSWYSESQPKEIVPAARVYVSGVVPPAVTSALSAFGFVNQPFSFFVSASFAPGTTTFALGAGSAPLPPGLTLNSTTGEISGTPTAAGLYNVAVEASSSVSGTGSSVVNIEILDTGSAITRELWTSGVTGPNLSDIPFASPPSTIDALASLEDVTSYPTDTGERLRGYFTAPSTGNYYFWLAANNVAELWISNDSEPINKVRRAYVSAPGTASKTWNAQASQKSPWLSLVAGQKYYLEVVRNCPAGSTEPNVAVGWFLDPTGTGSPIADGTGVVPGYVLSVYDYPQTVAAPGTLYSTNMAPQGAATTKATGTASLRLNADNTQAILHFNYSGLTSPRTGYHVHSDPYGIHSSQIIFDIDDVDSFHPELRTPDGGYIWNIGATGTLSAADVVAIIQQGKAYINIHSVNYPSGEIRGNFGRVVGSQSPPDPANLGDPGYADDHGTDAGAARFLNQATFGASPDDIAAVKAGGFDGWLTAQMDSSLTPPTHCLPYVFANLNSDPTNPYPESLAFNAWWVNAVTGPDQLRQRVAFALSEIMVVGASGPLDNNGPALASYYDTLIDSAFGDFRTLLKNVTLTPAMGRYLDMLGNQKGNLLTGLHPNENYGREILQLFSIGLNRLWPDGTLVLDSKGNLVPTYEQAVIQGVSRVLTGWTFSQPLGAGGRLPTNFSPSSNYFAPMVLVPTRHELGSKLVLDNVVLPAAIGYNPPLAVTQGSQADPAVQAFDDYCLADLEKVIDNIVNNQNVGPYICRQLIQRLVTSEPTPGYVYRVVQKFNDNGSGVRGDMKAVIRAILMDGEARSSAVAQTWPTFGKQREPLMRITGPVRAFPAQAIPNSSYRQSGGLPILVTTPTAHLQNNGDTVVLSNFVSSGGSPRLPASQGYSVGNSTPSYSLVAPSLGYSSSGSTVTINGAGYTQGNQVNVRFTSGGLSNTNGTFNGVFPIISATATNFTISLPSSPTPPTTATGNCLLLTTTVTVTAPGYQAGDIVAIQFTSGTLGSTAPYNTVQDYVVAAATPTNFTVNISPNTFASTSGNTVTPKNFTINAGSLASANYSFVAGVLKITAGGYVNGHQVYVKFASGGLLGGGFDGVYTVTGATASDFIITLLSPPANDTTGSCLIPRFSAGYSVSTSGGVSTITVSSVGNHGLEVGDSVQLDFRQFNNGTPAVDGVYTVTGVVDVDHFAVTTTPAISNGSQNTNGLVGYPLPLPPLDRAGTMQLAMSTFGLGSTNTELGMSPLNSPTVFNFYFPDFKYPGALAINGITTPEFQLTTDTNVVTLTNAVTNSVLASGNNNGLSSFRNNTSIRLNLNSHMTPGGTSDAAIPALVDKLSDLLIGGPLTPSSRQTIINFVANTTNFPYTTTGTGPTSTQMRDRVRAVVHLIITSAEYAIQK